MIKLKTTRALAGIDRYYVPADWMDVEAVYLIPMQKVTKSFILKRESFYQPYKVSFSLRPADTKDPVDPTRRSIQLSETPTMDAVLLCRCNILREGVS